MGSEDHHLHLFFFPLMAQGHIIPMIDMAKLFAQRGVHVSIITTPLNATRIQNTIDRTRHLGHSITIHLLQFPCSKAGLPDGCESLDSIHSFDMTMAFTKALSMLHDPFERLVEHHLPNCIVSDMFLPWTVDVAAKFNIPRLVFNGTSFFSLCVSHSLKHYPPQENVASDREPFLVPKLPHPIELTRSQLPDFLKGRQPFKEFMEQVKESDLRSYGVVMNSFYELEPAYAEFYKAEVISKAWHIGPVSLCNRDHVDRAQRGKEASIDPSECLGWLGLRKPESVLYVCFGSLCNFHEPQLMEIALALEASGHPFIWVVRNVDWLGDDWMPDGFEERTKEKGLIIKGWAPQVMILNHPAIGGFITHCGWNSVLEGVSSGVPMVTWPIFAEQFYNEKLITRVLKIGVEVGSLVWNRWVEDKGVIMGRQQIQRAVAQLMDGGDEADEMRKRARELSEMAKKALEESGSSYSDLSRVIEELRSITPKKND